MKKFSINRIPLSLLATPVFATGWLGFSLPSVAGNFVSNSAIDLFISNFNQLPIDVGVVVNSNTLVIGSELGEVEVELSLDSLFVSDEEMSSSFGFSIFRSQATGAGSDYLARTNTVSTLLGRFEIPANTQFSFDIQASALLSNFTTDLSLNPITNLGSIGLFLQDTSSQKTINILEFLGLINTSDMVGNNSDRFQFRQDSRTNVKNFLANTSFGGAEESIKLFLDASFHISVNQNTEFVLFASTRSCNDTSDGGGICTVPEPSTALGLIVGTIGLGGFGILRKVMNRIVQFIF